VDGFHLTVAYGKAIAHEFPLLFTIGQC